MTLEFEILVTNNISFLQKFTNVLSEIKNEINNNNTNNFVLDIDIINTEKITSLLTILDKTKHNFPVPAIVYYIFYLFSL